MENDELATYLNLLHLDEACRVDQVLKASDREVTELVSVPAENGSTWGPLVRKRIRTDARMGSAYGELYAAQRAGKRFRHLPAIYSVHERDDELIVLMEYVRGITLHEEVYQRDPSLALAQERFPALCDGVMEMHGEFSPPLIHRDLKPANVIVNGQGLTIIDFGIARSFRPEAATDTAPFATRAYAPPEQFGYGQTDERSDVYALGMVLYFLLTERNPTADLVARNFEEPDVPPALRPVLTRACAFDPRFRIQSVRELKEAFLQAVEASVSAPIASAPSIPLPVQVSTPEIALGTAGAPMGYPALYSGPTPAASPVPYGALVPIPEKPRPAYYELREQGWTPAQARKGVRDTLRASEIVGAVWDACLLFLWVLIVGLCATLPFDPSPEMAKYGLSARVVAYIGTALFMSGFIYASLDKRIFRRFIPFMRKQTFLRGLLVGLGLVVGGTIVILLALSLNQ